jgi:hypothetical protein
MLTVDLPPADRGARRAALLAGLVAGLVAGLLAGRAAPIRAQEPATAPTADGPHADARSHAAPLSGAAATGGLILLGAAGAQAIRTPDAWPRTAGGFGKRVADQTGFYLLQTGTQRALAAGLGWQADGAPCPRDGALALAGCAVARTFTAVDRDGARRPAVPFVASVVAATAASVAWRPERRSGATARTFVATRLTVVFAGYAGERLLVEWRRARASRAR